MSSDPPAALSLPHRLWRALPTKARRRWLARGAALLAPRPDRTPPPPRLGVGVGGELSRASGLGEGARLMLRALEVLDVPSWGFEAGLRAAGETDAGYPGGGRAEIPPGVPLVLHVNGPVLPAALLRLPRGLLRGRLVIGVWAWELPVVSPDWRLGVPFVHEIWVPSRFTRDAIEPLLPGRVRVVPYPRAVDPPRPSALGRDAFGLPRDAVVTLVSFSLASSFARKNPLAAIAAHRAAFGERPDRILLLKLANAGHFPDDLRRLREAASAPNVRLETRTLPAADNQALIACSDIVLSLHRSEGFGLVPAEAMLLGRPVVATGWSGNMDFMDEENSCLVPFRLVPARDPRGVFEAPGANWAEADVGAAAEWLRRLADDPALRARIGARARETARARLGVAPLAAALAGIGLTPAP